MRRWPCSTNTMKISITTKKATNTASFHERPLGVDRRERRRQARHDRAEDDERHAVADAALGDQLAHPHQQRGAGGEGETISSTRAGVKFGTRSIERAGAAVAAAVVEQEDQTGRLQHRDADGEVAGPLGDLALTDRTLLLPLLSFGITTPRICMMIELVMYGMMPSAKMLNCVSA
jgi:hypothetical protein